MNNNDINSAWAAVVPILSKLKFDDIKDIVGLAGFDMKTLNGLGIDNDNWCKKNSNLLVSEIGDQFLRFTDKKKTGFLNIVIEEVLSDGYSPLSDSDDNFEERLQYCLNRLGWQLIDKKVLPIEILDLSDLKELDSASQKDLINAAIRFRDGQLSGAITSAYGAVEHVISEVYKNNDLGEIDYNKSFQSRCKTALEATGVYSAIDSQLSNIEWHEGDVKTFKENLKGSVNQAALVLQSLRNNMADVHGTKPVIKPLVFDSIKWAQIIVRLLSEKYDV